MREDLPGVTLKWPLAKFVFSIGDFPTCHVTSFVTQSSDGLCSGFLLRKSHLHPGNLRAYPAEQLRRGFGSVHHPVATPHQDLVVAETRANGRSSSTGRKGGARDHELV